MSADAIEQLDPFVPISGAIDLGDGANSAAPSATAGETGGLMTRSVLGATQFQLLFTSLPLVICDVLVLLTSVALASVIVASATGEQVILTLGNQMVLLVAGYLLFGTLQGLFPGSGTSPVVELRQSVMAVWASFTLMLALNFTLAELSPWECALGVVGVALATVAVPLARMIIRKALSRHSWWGERVLIIGAGEQGKALFSYYNRAVERGLRVVGLVDCINTADYNDSEVAGPPYLGSVVNLARLSKRYRARWAIIAPGGSEQLDLGQVIANSSTIPNLLILPSQYLLPSLWATTHECAGVLGVHLRDHLQNPIALATKRSIDFLLAATAVAFLSPVFLLVVFLVKSKSPGPAFYGHRRIGRGGKTFRVWKFRTMVVNADQVLEQHLESDSEMRHQWIEDQKLKNDPRIIQGIGHFLRRTSLDELPQLWNVVRGDMSLVGPRPIVADEVQRYRNMYPLYLRVRPGITGLWQVSGRNDTSYEHRVRLDSYYVCNWSIWLDAYLVLRTVRTILMREGAY
ncbi:undecaprenyl-phosphate galactose phosphotransferase WbaP [Stieleria sp. TO1_6]|uniref:undecaprenyl-phosphate galactose phosphotransferase WbaP n=1 Tax=Stieleria tagensis TaxID=2956795 RepID=UPI00209BB116|nr:undecaprenyl-phosphate galactose phosphotransferase WbaP [Stieleria tagensis]MCO8121624.1 undecaprenyl-phosphate galactose phosphotransferase WbaP [Stieleria tagensis]